MSRGWSEIDLAGHTCHVYEPESANVHGYTVIYLHGVHQGRLSDYPAFATEFDRHGLRVIAPVTGRSWWTDRICREFDPGITAERYVLDRVLPYVAEHWNARPPRIALLGTSMGGQGALRLAYKHPNIFPTVAAISPAIDYYLRMEQTRHSDGTYGTLHEMYREPEDARQDSATLHIHPLNWPRNQFFCCAPSDWWWESADRLRMKLFSLGVPFECDLETSAGGHGSEYYSHMGPRAIEFLTQRLEQERLRV
jgi:S-formylglutathione hydrolase FrmB